MNLIKVSFYTSTSTAIDFKSVFILTNVIAVKIAQSGIPAKLVKTEINWKRDF